MSSNQSFAINHQKTPVIETEGTTLIRVRKDGTYSSTGTSSLQFEISNLPKDLILDGSSMGLKISNFTLTGGTAGRLKRSPNGAMCVFRNMRIKLGTNSERVIQAQDLLPINTLNRYLLPENYYNQADTMIGYYSAAVAADTELILPIGWFLPGGFFDKQIVAGAFPKIVIELDIDTQEEHYTTDTGDASVGTMSFTDPQLLIRAYKSPKVLSSIPSTVHFNHYKINRVPLASGLTSFSHQVDVHGKLQALWMFIYTDADLLAVSDTANHDSLWNTQFENFSSVHIERDGNHVLRLESAREARWHLLSYLKNHPTEADSLAGDFDANDQSMAIVWSPAVHPSHHAANHVDYVRVNWTFSSAVSATSSIYTVAIVEDMVAGAAHSN